MKAVYSHWDVTGTGFGRNWSSPKFFLYSLVNSVHQSKKIFGKVEMVTNSECVALFEKLELPFDKISTELDDINHYPKEFWSLGKIKAYSIQDEPFIHVDDDVHFQMYNENLKNLFENNDLVCQSIEKQNGKEQVPDCYVENINTIMEYGEKVIDNFGKPNYAHNMGFYLCKDLEFNKLYTDLAFEFIDINKDLMMSRYYSHPSYYCIIFEQYFFTCLAELKNKKVATFGKLDDWEVYKDYQYKHIWGAKKNEDWYKQFDNACKNIYPKQYEIIQNLVK